VSVPVVRPELVGTEGKVRHGDTFARRTGRYLKRLLASSAAADVAAAVQAIQQPVGSGRQIAVTSIRGGSGKSTVAALLALMYAHHRTDPVLAVEADPALGTLPRRLSATEVRWSCADLARIVDPSMRITDLIGYLLPYPGGGWLLPGSQGSVGAQLDLDTYRVVMTAMRRYFAATVVDCQTLPAEVARTALTTTQARVLVAPATVEGVAATCTVLEWLARLHRSMLPTTVVALTHTAPDSTLDVRRSTELLAQGGAHVVTLPYDRHLAGGGAVRTDLLALGTQEAAARLGGAVMDRAVSR
jgi:MinD-like ATPase involved in chromosome partitioning or flagellar assembly